jgi:hypothetical protein
VTSHVKLAIPKTGRPSARDAHKGIFRRSVSPLSVLIDLVVALNSIWFYLLTTGRLGAFLVLLALSGYLGLLQTRQLPINDKIVHFATFFILTVWLHASTRPNVAFDDCCIYFPLRVSVANRISLPGCSAPRVCLHTALLLLGARYFPSADPTLYLDSVHGRAGCRFGSSARPLTCMLSLLP